MSWLLMLMAALGVVLNVLYATEPLYSRTFGRLEGTAARSFGIAMSVALLLFAAWQHWVLTRPDIRTLFDRGTAFKK